MEQIEVEKYPLMGSNMQYDMGTRSFVERQQPPKTDMTLDKVLDLMTDPHSKKVKERHSRAVKKICDKYSNGFYLKDLGIIYNIIEALVHNLMEDEDYMNALIQIVMLCGKSFLKEKASDDVVYERDFSEFLVQLVKLVELPMPMVQIAVTHCIGSLYCTPVPIYPDGPQACRHELNIKAIEESNVVEIFASELKKMEDEAVYQEILHLLLFLSLSSSNCDSLLDMHMIEVVAKNMAGACASHNSKLLQLSIEVLWNIIEYGSPEKVPERFETMSVVKSLYSTFSHFIQNAKTKQDLQLRNDVMSVTQALVSHCPKAPFLECGFIKLLALVATNSEVKSNDDLIKGFTMKAQNDDFELKKLVWSTLISLCENDALRQVMIDHGFLTALFDYVKPNDSVCSVEWTSAQYEELQLQALSSLETLCPLCLNEYMAGHGNTRLIMLLEWACSECKSPPNNISPKITGDYGGHGNSFYGDGGYQTRRAQLRFTIRVLLAVVRTGNETVLQDLCDQGLIDALKVVLKKYDSTDVPIELGILSNALLILAVLCEHDSHRKGMFGDDGVELLLQFLSGDSNKFSSGLGFHKLLLSSVNAIWCCVSLVNQDLFLERGGIPILLDLLEQCPPSMQNLVLGALLDLTEDPRAVPHVVTWRGKGQKTAVSLLIELWRSEEHAMGVKRDSNHIITDPSVPLQGIEQLQSVVSAQTLSSTPTLAILDVGDNMRAKIYAMLYRIGFGRLPPVTTKDQITLTLIENYLDFKVGEVWEEIIAELMVDNVTPIKSDREALKEVQTIISAKSEAVKLHQLEILDRESKKELEEELQCYDQIKSNFTQWEQQNATRINFINKTSDYETLQLSKQRQNTLAEKSRIDPPGTSDTVEHNTILKMLTTTVHSGRHINVPLSDMRDLTSPHKVLPSISPTRAERSVVTQ